MLAKTIKKATFLQRLTSNWNDAAQITPALAFDRTGWWRRFAKMSISFAYTEGTLICLENVHKNAGHRVSIGSARARHRNGACRDDQPLPPLSDRRCLPSTVD